MEDYFEKKFTKNGGGKLNAVALGSSGDTVRRESQPMPSSFRTQLTTFTLLQGPNLLWHWENGIQQANLKPKVWFLMVGGNDLFESKCTDRFVQANVLNVLKRIYEYQPDAQFIVHGIMPRKDNPDSASNALGHLWNRAQDINLLLKKFTKQSSRVTFVNAGLKFTSGKAEKGRGAIDPSMVQKGMVPTTKGMKVWGDYIEKKILEVMEGFDKSRLKQKNKEGARIKKPGNKKQNDETRAK